MPPRKKPTETLPNDLPTEPPKYPPRRVTSREGLINMLHEWLADDEGFTKAQEVVASDIEAARERANDAAIGRIKEAWGPLGDAIQVVWDKIKAFAGEDDVGKLEQRFREVVDFEIKDLRDR